MKSDLYSELESTHNELEIGLVQYVDKRIITQEGEIAKHTLINSDIEKMSNEVDINIGLQIRLNEKVKIIPINEGELFTKLYRSSMSRENLINHPFQFIKSNSINNLRSDYLWDQITLTEKEIFVIEALQIIEPAIQRIAFIGETSNKRTPVVKVKDYEKVVPLKSMGDGINRILSIILSAVNCENGYLLIDEFENGLHFSVQEQLWKVLIHLSSVLNIQVFATTHSNDCIDGFENAIQNSNDSSIGVLYRLEKDKETGIKAVKFDLDEVKIATDENIEIR